jgi:hypothetical protein
MKKLFSLLLLAALAAGGAFALPENWLKSYAPGIEGSSFFVNAGIGYGLLPYKMSLPPVSVNVQYALKSSPFSVGGYFGYTGYNEDIGFINYSASMIGIGARGEWHINLAKNLDTYAALSLGYLLYNQETTTEILGTKTTAEADLSTFFYSFGFGARYFFTKNIGAYAELGYSAVSVASLGLALKF